MLSRRLLSREQRSPRSGRLDELDGVRGLAILFVLYWHYYVTQVHHHSRVTKDLADAGRLTWSGVDLFFVLSGFLIGGILLDNRRSRSYFTTFYARRACRILPAYLILLLSFGVVLVTTSGEWKHWLFDNHPPIWSFLTFTQNYLNRSGFDANYTGVTWSLAIEEQFYLVIPLMVLLLRGRRLVLCLLIAIALGPVMRAFFSYPGNYTYTFCRTDAIFLGVLLAWLVRQEGFVDLVRRYRLVLYALLAGLFFEAVQMTRQGREPGGVLVHAWLAGLYGAFVLVVFVFRKGWLARAMRAPWLIWLGTRSYAIYLLHQAMSGLIHGPLAKNPPQIRTGKDVLLTVGALAATLVVADVSWRTLERWFIAFGRRRRYAVEPTEGLVLPAP